MHTTHRKELAIHTSIELYCLIGRPFIASGEHFGTASLVYSTDLLGEVAPFVIVDPRVSCSFWDTGGVYPISVVRRFGECVMV